MPSSLVVAERSYLSYAVPTIKIRVVTSFSFTLRARRRLLLTLKKMTGCMILTQPQHSATTTAAGQRGEWSTPRRPEFRRLPAAARRGRSSAQASSGRLDQSAAAQDHGPQLLDGYKRERWQRALDRGPQGGCNYSSSTPAVGLGSSKPAKWQLKHGTACSGCRHSQSSGRGCATEVLSAVGVFVLMGRSTHPRSRTGTARAILLRYSPDERGVCLYFPWNATTISFYLRGNQMDTRCQKPSKGGREHS